MIAEDDADISLIEEAYLKAAGYDTVTVADGSRIEGMLAEDDFDLLLLDLMLPGKNGYDVCRSIRDKADIPILIVTARTEPVDKIRGLEIGADDYITKPFDPVELVARVHANLRQVERLNGPTQKDREPEVLCAGDLRIYPESRKAFKGDVEIKLANREFELLQFLARNPDIVFTKEQLMDRVWGYDYAGDGATVMVHINRLREK